MKNNLKTILLISAVCAAPAGALGIQGASVVPGARPMPAMLPSRTAPQPVILPTLPSLRPMALPTAPRPGIWAPTTLPTKPTAPVAAPVSLPQRELPFSRMILALAEATADESGKKPLPEELDRVFDRGGRVRDSGIEPRRDGRPLTLPEGDLLDEIGVRPY